MSAKSLLVLAIVLVAAPFWAAEPLSSMAPGDPSKVGISVNGTEVASSRLPNRFAVEAALLREMQRPVDWKLDGETVEQVKI